MTIKGQWNWTAFGLSVAYHEFEIIKQKTLMFQIGFITIFVDWFDWRA